MRRERRRKRPAPIRLAPGPVDAEAKERELRKFRSYTCRGFAGRPVFEGWVFAPFEVAWSMDDDDQMRRCPH
jgi:hypothetical protein